MIAQSLGGMALAGTFAGLLVCAAYCDFRRNIIPNWISLLLILCFLIGALETSAHIAIASHILTAAGVLAVGLCAFHFRLMGGGDIKLWTAIALWLGPHLVVPHAVLVAILGGMLGLTLLVARGIASKGSAGNIPWRVLTRTTVPYGIAIAAGALFLAPRIELLWF